MVDYTEDNIRYSLFDQACAARQEDGDSPMHILEAIEKSVDERFDRFLAKVKADTLREVAEKAPGLDLANLRDGVGWSRWLRTEATQLEGDPTA